MHYSQALYIAMLFAALASMHHIASRLPFKAHHKGLTSTEEVRKYRYCRTAPNDVLAE